MESKNYEKVDKLAPYLYPIQEVAGGIFKAYFSTYISLLMTNIYLFSVTLAGILESLTSVSEWIGSALFGVVFDKFRFKDGSKYWPWFIFGGVGGAVLYIIIFAMPNFAADPSKLAVPAAVCIFAVGFIIMSVNHLGPTVFTQLATTPEMRTKLSSLAKFGRDGMKIILGFITPAALVAFTNMYNGVEVKAWALLAYIYAGVALLIYLWVAFQFKNCWLERDNRAGLAKVQEKKDKVPFSKLVKVLFTSRSLIAVFVAFCLIKVYYFIHINAASYTFRYFYGNMSFTSIFMTCFNGAAVVGALFAASWLKIWKSQKKSIIMDGVFALIGYIATYFTMQVGGSPIPMIISIAWTSFFSGMMEPFVLGMIADAADVSCFKNGVKAYGTSMIFYSLAVRFGLLGATWLRVGALNRGGFDAAALDAGGAVSDALYAAIKSLQTTTPLIVLVVAIAVCFLYNVTNKQAEEARAGIAEWKLQDSVK